MHHAMEAANHDHSAKTRQGQHQDVHIDHAGIVGGMRANKPRKDMLRYTEDLGPRVSLGNSKPLN